LFEDEFSLSNTATVHYQWGKKGKQPTISCKQRQRERQTFRDKSELLSLISDIKDDLYDLSKVQLKEGKRQMSLSEKTMDTIELFTQVEIIFLIVMAVLIQLIVLYQPKDKKQSQAQE
jgi:hypothetical protein